MSETSEISDDEDVIDIVAIEPDEDQFDLNNPDAESRRPLWPFALFGGVLLGFAAAFGASWYLLKPTPYDAAPLQAEIDRLREQVAALEAKPDPEIPRVNLAPIRNRIAALEARPTVDPLSEEIVARMEALQADGFEVPELPDMSALEARILELETKILDLENLPVATALSEIAAAPTVDPATLPRLPVQALRDGVAELGGSGFLRRTLNRHVRVKGDDNPDRLVDLIVQDLEAGRAQSALAKFDRLPPEVQSLARGWRVDMEAALQ